MDKQNETCGAFSPTACRDPFWMVQWSKSPSYFQLIQGIPAAQKLGVCEYPEAIVRPFGAPRPDLFDLLVHREGVQNWCFLASHQNIKNQRISRTWEAHVAILNQKHDFWNPFWRRFVCMTYNQETCLVFNTFQWFWTIKNHWVSESFLIVFWCVFKTAPRDRS